MHLNMLFKQIIQYKEHLILSITCSYIEKFNTKILQQSFHPKLHPDALKTVI
jgi:hypothetical protein